MSKGAKIIGMLITHFEAMLCSPNHPLVPNQFPTRGYSWGIGSALVDAAESMSKDQSRNYFLKLYGRTSCFRAKEGGREPFYAARKKVVHLIRKSLGELLKSSGKLLKSSRELFSSGELFVWLRFRMCQHIMLS